MEEELYRQCSGEDPTECEIDELIDLLNDEDCPHLITVQHTYHTFVHSSLTLNRNRLLLVMYSAIIRYCTRFAVAMRASDRIC